MAGHVGLDLGSVFDQHAGHGVAQFPRIAGLAAALGVERRVVEHDDRVLAGAVGEQFLDFRQRRITG